MFVRLKEPIHTAGIAIRRENMIGVFIRKSRGRTKNSTKSGFGGFQIFSTLPARKIQVPRAFLFAVGVFAFFEASTSFATALDDYPVSSKKHSPSSAPFTRDLNSVSLDDMRNNNLDTGVYHGSDAVLQNKKLYEKNFYNTLASRKRYIDEERTQWTIEPIHQSPPPPCDQQQPTKYDAESCRYVKALFKDIEKVDPARAKRYRDQVRRGRDVWFKGTFGNQDMYNIHLKEILKGVPDYTELLDTRKRDKRFKNFGLINDPGCRMGNEKTFWLDECDDPHASGVLGIRKYYAEPAKDFDPQSSPYQTDELKSQKRFVFGHSCASCHVSFDPTNPPADPSKPKWENLMGGIGNQYIRHSNLFTQGLPKDYFLRVLMAGQRPGTSDTSVVANDYIHNPGTINSIMNTHNRPLFEHKMTDPLTGEMKTAKTRHVLKGGEDSVGERLALLRVFVNIGMCALECWVSNFPEIGALISNTEQKPFRIKMCSSQCEAWNHADAKMEDLLAYLLTIGPTYLDKAVDVDGTPGHAYIKAELVPEGRQVFIENCATCHSSKKIPEFIDKNDKEVMKKFFKGHVFGGFHSWEREIPPQQLKSREMSQYFDEKSGKLKQILSGAQDWLGNDQLIPFGEIGVNRCRAYHTNHKEGHIFDEFSSVTYKEHVSAGTVNRTINRLFPLVGGKQTPWKNTIDGGPGYMRNISLLSVWSSAPLLHNNALGPYAQFPDGTPDYTVRGRVKSFEESMKQLLMSDNPEVASHRKPAIWKVDADVSIPMREDGKGLSLLTLKKKSPIGHMGSVNAHHPIFSQCDDYIENKGHQFGIDLDESEKTALIEFLKTL